jgi:hypothetical protein
VVDGFTRALIVQQLENFKHNLNLVSCDLGAPLNILCVDVFDKTNYNLRLRDFDK